MNVPNVRKTVAYWKGRIGKTVDIPSSSYASDLELAKRLIGMGDPKEQLMFIVSNDKRAIRITLGTHTPDEDEWICAGRFKVMSVHSEEFEDGSIRRTSVEIEQTAVFGLWGEHVPRTVSDSGPEGPSGTPDFDLVLVETFDEIPYLLADPFDRSDRTLFD